MFKKLTLLALSVGALLAFAAPAAQATGPLITNSDGGTPTFVTALSENTTTTTTTGINLECKTVDLTLHLTQNANTTATGHGTGKAEGTPKAVGHALQHTGHCGTSSGAVAEITSVTVKHIHLTKHGTETTGTATFTFTYDLRSATGAGLIAECTFGNPKVKAVVKKTGTDTVNISAPVERTAGGAFCPTTGEVKGDFKLTEDITGKGIHIH